MHLTPEQIAVLARWQDTGATVTESPFEFVLVDSRHCVFANGYVTTNADRHDAHDCLVRELYDELSTGQRDRWHEWTGRLHRQEAPRSE